MVVSFLPSLLVKLKFDCSSEIIFRAMYQMSYVIFYLLKNYRRRELFLGGWSIKEETSKVLFVFLMVLIFMPL